MKCYGSQELKGFSLGQVSRLSDATGKAAAAKVTCPVCGKHVTARVIYSQQGNSLGSHGMAVIPNHKEEVK